MPQLQLVHVGFLGARASAEQLSAQTSASQEVKRSKRLNLDSTCPQFWLLLKDATWSSSS